MNYKLKIRRKSFLKNLAIFFLSGLAAASIVKPYTLSPALKTFSKNPNPKKNSVVILKEIYNEIIELGSYGQQNFIKREFFIDLDGNSLNKEEHVVVLNNRAGEREKMIIQVTYFEPKKGSRAVRYAKNTRKILCLLKNGNVKIEECDYSDKEIEFLLPEILKGIRSKKKLLRLIHQNKL